MMRLSRYLFIAALFALLGFTWPLAWINTRPNLESTGTIATTTGARPWLEKELRIIKSQANNIDTKVLRLSLNAYMKARQKGLDNKELLTVIDYSKPSNQKRLWVFDLKHGRTLFNTWVSHGKNSGGVNANSFSNSPGSLKSSLGVFVTDVTPYIGGNGYSLRLHGLEPGINDNAYSRDIVIHGAWYVGADAIHHYGSIGRSWGCPAVNPSMAKSLIDTIKQNTVIFAYYPDRNWLSHSKYV